jgi:formamidopyrimidine-DNA glycosylase
MPELPEVENVRLSLEGLGTQGQRFSKVDLRAPKLRTPLAKNLKIKLPGESIIGLTRRAKFLLFETEKYFVVSHLGMTGSWRPREGAELIKHDHVVFRFHSGFELVFNDPRRFGLLELVEKSKIGRHAWLKNLGPEPFDDSFTGQYLFESTRGLSAPIKNVIMDQKRVVGVGNIYASEALFLAKIKPSRPAGKITKREANDLVSTIRTVLTKAIKAGGSTIRDYRNSNGESGQFQDQFVVYGRSGEPCVTCSVPLKSKFIGQRNTFWCSKCQR